MNSRDTISTHSNNKMYPWKIRLYNFIHIIFDMRLMPFKVLFEICV